MDWNRSLCNTCRQNLSVVKARADPQTFICTRPYKNLLIRRRKKRNQSIGRMGPTFPQCHLNSRQTNHKYGIGPHEQYGRHAGNGCRQYAPCITSEHPGCVHLGATHPCAGFAGWNQSAANIIQIDLPCRPCSLSGEKHCYRKDYACLQGITPEMVIEHINKVIS